MENEKVKNRGKKQQGMKGKQIVPSDSTEFVEPN